MVKESRPGRILSEAAQAGDPCNKALTCSICPLTKAPPPEIGIRNTAATSRRVILGEE